jgi:hypothetical protein
MSQGGAVAIAYAVRHPDKVSHLILPGAYARGALQRGAGDAQRLEAETLVNLIRLGWGRDNAAFRQVFTNQFIPGGSPTQHQWWNELERLTASPENAARTLEAFHRIDVTELARRLQVPTLVLHARGDARVPFDEGLRLAALIPGARFVPLNSDNHVLLDTEPAWAPFLAELRAFLGTGPADARPAPGDGDGDGDAALTPAEREVLRLVATGLDNHAIAQRCTRAKRRCATSSRAFSTSWACTRAPKRSCTCATEPHRASDLNR